MDTTIEPTADTMDIVAQLTRLYHSNAPDVENVMGRLLAFQRDRCRHGEWLRWCAEANLPFGPNTARLLIQAYHEWAERADRPPLKPVPKPTRPKPQGWDAAVAIAEAI